MHVQIDAGPDEAMNGAIIWSLLKTKDMRLTLGPGNYKMPPFVTVLGAGLDVQGVPGEARPNLLGSTDRTGWCCFELSDGVHLRHLAMAAPSGVGIQSQVLGFQRKPYDAATNKGGCQPGSRVWLDDVHATGGSFALEVWTCQGAQIHAYRCLFGGNWAVTAGGSSGPDAQTIDLYDCTCLADRAACPGADASQGFQTAAVVGRGGLVRCFGGLISTRGALGTAAYGVLTTTASEHPQDPATWPSKDWPRVELHGTKITVEPAGSAVFDDTFAQIGTIARDG